MHVTAIIAAAGAGSRLGGGVPKQFLAVGGMSVLQRALEAFYAAPRVTDVIVVTRREALAQAAACVTPGGKPTFVVEGGETRQASVACGVARLAESANYVLVHDAARPFVTPALIERALDAAIVYGAAIVALPVTDTVKRVAGAGDTRRIVETIPRDTIYLAQTPQAFRRDVLEAAVALGRAGVEGTDEAALAEQAGHAVRIVEGEAANVKITTAGDLERARQAAGVCRILVGTGYDLHTLVEGRPLVLGGVHVPSERGALGHSDADVVCHAVTDAILGAAALGDIGRHFPDTDPAWKDASSLDLLARAAALVRGAGYGVANVDVSVILERPKVAPFTEAIRKAVAGALELPVSRVSVKGKTNEGVDAVGRGEAIAAHAVALLETTAEPTVGLGVYGMGGAR
jgi:2-C-methyl-D-erythritol 4-phosphate cytidylyltransferase / 2-C-methyl-D-erythritol 2,4-cyclodiphosphate synthase